MLYAVQYDSIPVHAVCVTFFRKLTKINPYAAAPNPNAPPMTHNTLIALTLSNS